MTKICVLGLGYIGLPTACMFATHGYDVIGVDIDQNVAESLDKGDVKIKEPELKALVQESLKSKKLIVKTKPGEADVFIICVPTPLNKGTDKADLSYVVNATESIVRYLKKGNLIILESTVPPRTTEDVLIPILEKSNLKARDDLYMAHCPERVLPGRIVKELIENDRIVGGIDRESAERAKELYKSFVKGDIYITDARTAEMVKLMENTYRDVNIALANEFAKISERLGIDVWKAVKLANKHPRVEIHAPGPGVGGHCISVDPWFIVERAPEEAKLITMSRNINDSMPDHVFKIVENQIKGIRDPMITVFGVSYKKNVNDVRETPALRFIELVKEKYKFKIYDPHVKNFRYELTNLEDSVENSDCIVVLVDHDDFNLLDVEKISRVMRTKILVDTKNCLDHEKWGSSGFKVRILGVSKNG